MDHNQRVNISVIIMVTFYVKQITTNVILMPNYFALLYDKYEAVKRLLKFK